MNSTDIQWSAILSWGYADNILRLKSKQSEPPVNFIQSSQQYQVSVFIIVMKCKALNRSHTDGSQSLRPSSESRREAGGGRVSYLRVYRRPDYHCAA